MEGHGNLKRKEGEIVEATGAARVNKEPPKAGNMNAAPVTGHDIQ